jgi:hypothetical protein
VEDTVTDNGVKTAYSILQRHEPTPKYKVWCDIFGVKYADYMNQETADARTEGEKCKAVEVAQKMIKGGRPVAEIVEFTGLTEQEVEVLQKPVR